MVRYAIYLQAACTLLAGGCKPTSEPVAVAMTDASVSAAGDYDVWGSTDGGPDVVLGTVRVALDGTVTVRAVGEAVRERLERIVAASAARTTLTVDAPCGSDAPRFAQCSRVLQRGTPEFTAALVAQLGGDYGYHLRPAAPGAR